MSYTQEQQLSLDLDWFALDSENTIIHVASGGGKLPFSVANYESDNQKLRTYFEQINPLSEDIIVSESLSQFVSFSNNEQENRYLKDFQLMAKKGLYSFDKSILGDFDDTNYHLVCKPIKQLEFEQLPFEIKDILQRTRLVRNIKEAFSISIERDLGSV